MTVKKTTGGSPPQPPKPESKKPSSAPKQPAPQDSKVVKNDPKTTKTAVNNSFGKVPTPNLKSPEAAPKTPAPQPATASTPPGSDPKTPATDAKKPDYPPVNDPNGQQVKDGQGNPVVKDPTTGANVALDTNTKEPALDPKSKAPVALDDKGQPTDAPKSIPPNDKITTNDVNSPDYPKYFKDPAGDVHYYRKDNTEIKQGDPDSPVAKLQDKEGKVHFYDTKTGQEITHPKDHRLPDNLPADGPNALKEPPPPPPPDNTSTSTD